MNAGPKVWQEEENHRLLFFGLGSIGSRLAGLIRQHFDYDVYAFRTREGNTDMTEILEFYDLDELTAIHADVAFITNPTALHVDSAILCARQGMHLYVEKPLSHSRAQLPQLIDLVQQKHLLTHVGCVLRFDPILQRAKEILATHEIIKAEATCASYLPEWRPNQDYRNSYSASRQLGGGVVLDLIHEPDYCHWLFGPIERIKGRAGKISNLEIQTEDYADMTLFHASGVESHLHLDYCSKKKERILKVFCKDIYLEGDLLRRTMKIITHGKVNIEAFPELLRGELYLAELRNFFTNVTIGINPINNFLEHLQVLEPVLDFRERMGLAG